MRNGFFNSLVKQDLETHELASWMEKDSFPGEPVFVATPNAAAECARAYAPHVIPFGFHGNYFPDAA
jgi:beta,beta-carotene 9',10'-dioxygenase